MPASSPAETVGVILDLEGSTTPGPIEPQLRWMLSLASAAVAGATLLIVAALPHDVPRHAAESGPSILEQALAKKTPVPRLSIILPAEVAVPLSQIGMQDGTGNRRSAVTPRSFRLRGSNDVVSVAPVPDAPAIISLAQRTADSLAVHGHYAEWWTVEPTSVSVLRWTENGTTYEISSRTLMPNDLARIADLLR
jgi:hypothetical protein